MKYFTKQDITKLSKLAHKELYTAALLDYKRATSIRVNDLVADIYDETTGFNVERNWSCATCTFNTFKKIGKLYIASMENLNISYDEHGQTKK